MRILIIGAGIGGLTAAIALRKAGHTVEVCERAPQLREVGAGIGLWGNAVGALRQLGLADAVLARGERMRIAEFRLASGKLVAGLDAPGLEAAGGEPLALVHRAHLLEELARALPPGAIQCGNEFESVAQPDQPLADATPLRVRFEDGRFRTPDLLIGADGLHSAVRARIFGAQSPVYAGYTCWRGVVDFPSETIAPGYVGEFWGRGARFGVTRIGGGRVYWWATLNAPATAAEQGAHDTAARERLQKAFGEFPAPVGALLDATNANRIIRNDIYDRPPLADWRRGRVLLIGDAAHPTTPNLGQGGCMAIEDGVRLGAALQGAVVENLADLDARLTAFVTSRRAKTDLVVRESRRFGAIGQWKNPLACWCRNLMMSWRAEPMIRRSIETFGRFEPLSGA